MECVNPGDAHEFALVLTCGRCGADLSTHDATRACIVAARSAETIVEAIRRIRAEFDTPRPSRVTMRRHIEGAEAAAAMVGRFIDDISQGTAKE